MLTKEPADLSGEERLIALGETWLVSQICAMISLGLNLRDVAVFRSPDRSHAIKRHVTPITLSNSPAEPVVRALSRN